MEIRSASVRQANHSWNSSLASISHAMHVILHTGHTDVKRGVRKYQCLENEQLCSVERLFLRLDPCSDSPKKRPRRHGRRRSSCSRKAGPAANSRKRKSKYRNKGGTHTDA